MVQKCILSQNSLILLKTLGILCGLKSIGPLLTSNTVSMNVSQFIYNSFYKTNKLTSSKVVKRVVAWKKKIDTIKLLCNKKKYVIRSFYNC